MKQRGPPPVPKKTNSNEDNHTFVDKTINRPRGLECNDEDSNASTKPVTDDFDD